MKVSTFSKATIGLAAAATMGFGLVVPAANATGAALTATQEDPSASAIGPNTLVGVGSDTIQDVEYGISQDLGSTPDGKLNLASWTATGTTAMSYRSGGAPAATVTLPAGVNHPNGSGPGYTQLKVSLGISTTGGDGVAPGDVDYSRASGFQGTEVTGGAGAVTEIPFAIDSISFAAPANSPFAKTNGNLGLTLADLASIYLGTDKYVDTANGDLLATATPNVSGDPTLPIQAYLPKPGSGSRQFFLKQLHAVNQALSLDAGKGDAFQANSGTPAVDQPYVGNVDLAGHNVQEHDATALLKTDPTKVAAIAPFSGAKFIGYHNGIIADPSEKVAGTDYELLPFDSAVGGTAHSVLPYTNNSGTYAPNLTYKTDGTEGTATLTREVFNIVATRAINNPNASVKNRELYDTFAGAGSKFCLDSAMIQAYGFIKDANCGSTSRTADPYSTPTATVTHTAAVAGKTSVFTVNVTSNGNGGGTVAITINGKLYTGSIAAGATSVNFTVPTPAAGTFKYGNDSSNSATVNDGFTPNLDGVGAAPINTTPGTPLTYSVAKSTATITATALKISHTSAGGYTVVRVTAPGLTATGNVAVQLKTSTGVLKYNFSARALSGGAVKYLFSRTLAPGNYVVWVAYTGNGNINGKTYTKTAAVISVY